MGVWEGALRKAKDMILKPEPWKGSRSLSGKQGEEGKSQ